LYSPFVPLIGWVKPEGNQRLLDYIALDVLARTFRVVLRVQLAQVVTDHAATGAVQRPLLGDNW
jgi:hypothetical protein